jgi:hypothetical protein
MKAKINEFGELSLQRNGFRNEFIEQICHMNNDEINCSDCCPLFGEPTHNSDYDLFELELCHKTLTLEAIEY